MKIKWITDRWQRRIRDYCDASYELISVLPGDLNDYNRCQNVATHYALKNCDEKIAAVLYRHSSDLLPMVHFINYHDGKFIDNSIGWRAEYYEYRFVRWVGKEELTMSSSVLRDLQKYFWSMSSLIERILGNIEN